MEEIFMINQLMTQLSNMMKSEKYQQENNGILMPPHYLTNFEIQKYYKNKPRFNGVFPRKNLPKKIKDVQYVINLDEYADVSTHWIDLFCKRNEIVQFDIFDVKHIPEEIK